MQESNLQTGANIAQVIKIPCKREAVSNGYHDQNLVQLEGTYRSSIKIHAHVEQ